MRLGYEIARVLKELEFDTSNARQTRALMVANACAYTVKLDLSKGPLENFEDQVNVIKKVAGQVNENIALDTKLATELFRRAIFIRYELASGCADPAIITMAMRSHVAEMNQTPDETVVSNALTSQGTFVKQLGSIQALLVSAASEEV